MSFLNGAKIKVKFDVGCLKQGKITFDHGNILYVYIFCEINLWSNDLDSKFASLNSLFSAVKLIKNADTDKYSYFE